MAESVDALVSNTSGAIHPGSIPGPGTDKGLSLESPLFFVWITLLGCCHPSLQSRDNVIIKYDAKTRGDL